MFFFSKWSAEEISTFPSASQMGAQRQCPSITSNQFTCPPILLKNLRFQPFSGPESAPQNTTTCSESFTSLNSNSDLSFPSSSNSLSSSFPLFSSKITLATLNHVLHLDLRRINYYYTTVTPAPDASLFCTPRPDFHYYFTNSILAGDFCSNEINLTFYHTFFLP